MALVTNAQAIKQGYVDACNAVLTRGGSVTSGAPIGDLSKSILAIPHDQTLTYHTGVGTKMQVTVPQSVEKYALVDKVGGMTYKSDNKISLTKKTVTENGVTCIISENNTITLNGTTTDGVYIPLPIPRIQEDVTYYAYLGGNLPSGCELILEYTYSTEDGDLSDLISISDGEIFEIRGNADVFSLQINEVGIIFDNVIFSPSIVEFKGLRATKVTELVSEGANYFDKSKVSNATVTDTGFSFTNTTNESHPYAIGVLKDLAPDLKVGDVVTFYANVINPQKTSYANGFLYITGASKNWYGGTFITITEAHLTGNVYAYGKLNEVCEYKNLIITKSVGATYKPYVGKLDTLTIPEYVRNIEGYGDGVNEEYYNYVDFKRKMFVQRVYEVDLGELVWRKQQADNRFITPSLPKPSKPYNLDTQGLCLCSKYDTATWAEVNRATVNRGIAIYENQVYVVDTQYNDVEAFKNAINGVKLIYELAEHIEVDISAYLTDEGIIVEGGGTITAVNEYRQDLPTEITYLINTTGGG